MKTARCSVYKRFMTDSTEGCSATPTKQGMKTELLSRIFFTNDYQVICVMNNIVLLKIIVIRIIAINLYVV